MNVVARNVKTSIVPLVGSDGSTKVNHVRLEFDIYRIGGDEALMAKGATLHLEAGKEDSARFAKLFETTYHVRVRERRAIDEAVRGGGGS